MNLNFKIESIMRAYFLFECLFMKAFSTVAQKAQT